MKLSIGHKVMITDEYYNWYHTDSDINPSEGRKDHMKVGEFARIVNPVEANVDIDDYERVIKTCDNRVYAIVPADILINMRKAYLERNNNHAE